MKGVTMKENAVVEKSFAFAVRIVKLYRHLSEQKKEYVLSKQLLRCGTSIGANISEAQRAQSMPDFHTKMTIALKEANETLYWLRLLHETDYISTKQYNSIYPNIDELLRIITAICKSAKQN